MIYRRKVGKWLNVDFFVERFLPGEKKMMNKLKLDYAAPALDLHSID
jgi:hypothetical protein